MAKRQALGRGLSALLEQSDTQENKKRESSSPVKREPQLSTIAMLKIGQIEANPLQPRTKFDQGALEELAQSIRELGIIQPITVRNVGVNKYQLISGERRFRASQIAELNEIPAYVRSVNDQELLEMALVENIQRENLDPIEVAISYQRLIDECDLTQEQLSDRVGKNRSTVTNYIRLLKLPAEIQVGLIEGKISMGHARALISCGSESVQVKFYRDIIKHGLSVRKIEDLIRNGSDSQVKRSSSKTVLSFEDQKIRDELKQKFGSRVLFKKSDNGSGKIELKFTSEEELDRIIRELNL